MPTITATADSTKAQVRLDLDFSDIDAPYAYVTRVDPITGMSTAVRNHGLPLTIGALPYAPMQAGYKATLYDTEMPLDSAFSYVATAPVVTMNATSVFTGLVIDPWYPSDPAIFLRVTANKAGSTFLAFNTAGATATPTIRGEDIAATPGASWTATATVSANVSQSVTVGMTFRDSTGAILSSTATTVTVLASTTIVATGAAPANTVSAQPYILAVGTPAATTIVSVASFVVTTAAGTATSSGVTAASLGGVWLKDPLRPGNNILVHFSFDQDPLCIPNEGVFLQSMDVESQSANAAAFNVNNQPNPVVVSKQRSSLTSTLTLVSRTFQDRDRLIVTLAPGTPLLLQVPDQYGIPDRYMAIGADTVSRLWPDHRMPIRVFGLPFSQTSAPGGSMQGTVSARWSDTCSKYATWAAVNSAGLTWVQVLDGQASV